MGRLRPWAAERELSRLRGRLGSIPVKLHSRPGGDEKNYDDDRKGKITFHAYSGFSRQRINLVRALAVFQRFHSLSLKRPAKPQENLLPGKGNLDGDATSAPNESVKKKSGTQEKILARKKVKK